MAAAIKQKRTPNVQPNHLPTALDVTITLADGTVAQAQVPQVDNLSAAGNIWYLGTIKQGLVLPGEPEEALGGLSFEVLGVKFRPSESGVHLSAPQVRNGRELPNTGGNLTVTHTAVVDVPSTDGTTKPHTVMATTTYLGDEKGGALTIKGLPRALVARGPQVVGTFAGLTVIERA